MSMPLHNGQKMKVLIRTGKRLHAIIERAFALIHKVVCEEKNSHNPVKETFLVKRNNTTTICNMCTKYQEGAICQGEDAGDSGAQQHPSSERKQGTSQTTAPGHHRRGHDGGMADMESLSDSRLIQHNNT